MKSKLAALLVMGCVVVCATLAAADTTVTIQHSESGGQPQTQYIYIADGKTRMEQPGGGQGGPGVMIYHQASNTFYAIDTARKTYMELDPEKFGAMMDEAAKMREQMMAQLEQQMAGMSEEQKAQMKAMMEARGGMMPGEQVPTRYEPTGKSGSATGTSCSWYDAFEGQRKVRELCVAKPSALGMPAADTATIKAMMESMKAIAQRMGGESFLSDNMPDGIPAHVRHFNPQGTVTSEQITQSVDTGGLDSSLFEVPADYKRQELPQMPR